MSTSESSQNPPPLPKGRASRSLPEQPKFISRTIACAVILFGGIAIIFLFSALLSVYRANYLGLTFYGLAFLVFAAAAAAVRIIADRTYKKLVQGFYDAGKDWENASFSIFARPSTPGDQRDRDIIAWARDSNLTYYEVRTLPLLTKIFYMMHFGKMREKIMKQYQQEIPDSNPLKFRYWRNLTPQMNRHWENYFSAHPDFLDFADDRLYAPWAGLVWGMAIAGFLDRMVIGKQGHHELLAFDQTTVDKDDPKKQVKCTRVMVSSPYRLKRLFIAPERKGDSHGDVDFESIEFNENFRVEADEKRWAYDVITTRTMAILLKHKGFVVDFDAHYITAHKGDILLTPIEMNEAMTLLVGMADLLPSYLSTT